MITLKAGEQTLKTEEPMTVEEALNRMLPGGAYLGAFSGGKVLDLKRVLDRDAELTPITYRDEEGRRIYERTLRYILLLAAGRLFPGRKLRFEHSLGYGVYIRFMDAPAAENETAALELEMKRIVEEDLPFIKEDWTRAQAVGYFEKLGMEDKVKLLSYRTEDHFHVYCCGELKEYFYGPVLPSTGYAKVFSVWKCRDGFVMQLPSPQDPEHPAEAVIRPMHLEAFTLSAWWCRVLGCNNAADLNDMIREGRYREFIRVNEALQDRAIAAIADRVRERQARAVFIAGPSSSGKTTFANRLSIHLRVLGFIPKLVSLDDFYRDREDLPLEADGRPDLESLNALDVPLIRECVGDLLQGKTAQMPRFDFHTQARQSERVPMALKEGEILLIEGIHGLNPALHEGFDKNQIYKVFITELTCLNLDDHNRIRTTDARLLRRIVRDYRFRGTEPAETMAMWPSVRAGEEKWIFPYQEEADSVINSALHYELPLMRALAFDQLKKTPMDSAIYPTAFRLMKILRYFLPAPEECRQEIPPLSIIREFIGGNTFYDE